MVRILLGIIYVLTAATIGSLVGLMQGLSTGILCGLFVLLLELQVHTAISRRKEAKVQKTEIAGLKKSGAAMQKALSETQAKMEDVSRAMEARASAQNRKIVSELQVLESLMKEFASRISDKARHEKGGRPAGAPASLEHVAEPELLEMIRA